MKVDLNSSQQYQLYPLDQIASEIAQILNHSNLTAADIQKLKTLASQLNQSSFGTAGDTIGPVSRLANMINSLDLNNPSESTLSQLRGTFFGAEAIDTGYLTDSGGVYLLETIFAAASDYAKASPDQKEDLVFLLNSLSAQAKRTISPSDSDTLNTLLQELPISQSELSQFAASLLTKYFSAQ